MHGLAERDFDLKGHILADIFVPSSTLADGYAGITVEALTVADSDA